MSASLTTIIVASPRSPVATVTAVTLTPAGGTQTRHADRPRPGRRGCTGSLSWVIDHDVLERVLDGHAVAAASSPRCTPRTSARRRQSLDDGRVEQVTSGRDRGAGIRVVAGDTTGFAHTADLSEPGLSAAAEAAAAAARQGGGGTRTVAPHPRRDAPVNTVEPLPRRGRQGRQGRRCCGASTKPPALAGAAIVQVSAGYGDSRKRILVANSDGLLADDEVVRCLMRISVVANGDTGMQTGFQSMGHTIGFEVFDSVDVEELARDAARQAITKLNARPAPSGSMPVVIKRGSGGVLFHEACGHGLEADLVAKGASVYAGKVGELVASPLVTLVDDGTMAGEWGTLGDRRRGPPHPAQRAHRGRRAHRLHVGLPPRPQGGPRAERQRPPPELHAPADGADDQHVRARRRPSDPDDIIRATEHGVYVAKLGGGRSTRRPATSCSG